MSKSGGSSGGTAVAVDEDLSRDVMRHVLGVMQAIKQHVADLAVAFDLTLSQLDALKNLGAACSQRELAQCLHFDASNVTDIVDRLEERGLVQRTIDPNDRRVRRLVLTPEGEAVRAELFEHALAGAPVTALSPSEQRSLCALLGKIADPVDLPL
jgi:MarR family transcriptional regulator, organic hydroperoxide resistance regulator